MLTRPGATARRGWFRVRGAAMFEAAYRYNLDQIAAGAAAPPGSVVCDVGCWDGETFLVYAPPGAVLRGIEQHPPAVEVARSRGIDAVVADINGAWPLESESVDVVTSNQVIEHVADTDHFAREVFRILRPGGTAVVSTENLASWHNIAATLVGWQPFSLTNVSRERASIGNPLSNLRHSERLLEGWQHVRVFAYRGLIELFQTHGFVDVSISGAGYYPLPARVADVDPRHAAFITVRARRPTG